MRIDLEGYLSGPGMEYSTSSFPNGTVDFKTLQEVNITYDGTNLKIVSIRKICKQCGINIYTPTYRYKVKKELIREFEKYLNE